MFRMSLGRFDNIPGLMYVILHGIGVGCEALASISTQFSVVAHGKYEYYISRDRTFLEL